MIAVGFIALAAPLMAGIAIELVVGWLFILNGCVHAVYAWQVRGAGGVLWEGLLGVLYVLAGGYLLFHPIVGLESLTFVLGIYLVIKAVLELILSAQLRPYASSVWLMADGIISFILAIIIWRMWPVSSLWAIGILIGISILLAGAARLALAMSARRLLKD
jgi:uncharacterized membrane protein HdeD (DUF308 family)